MFFLNSLIPLPIEPAISGIRLAPKSKRITTMMMSSSDDTILKHLSFVYQPSQKWSQ